MILHPEEDIALHPADAAALGVADGDMVKVSSRRGSLVVRARVSEEMKAGTAFMCFHFYGQPTNVLTQQALDPASKTPEYKVTAIKVEKAAE
jgi:anaerobic selenocysteine-containing dehydrogenase